MNNYNSNLLTNIVKKFYVCAKNLLNCQLIFDLL